MSAAIAKKSKCRFDLRFYGIKQLWQGAFVGTIEFCQREIGDRTGLVVMVMGEGKHGRPLVGGLILIGSQLLFNRPLTIKRRG